MYHYRRGKYEIFDTNWRAILMVFNLPWTWHWRVLGMVYGRTKLSARPMELVPDCSQKLSNLHATPPSAIQLVSLCFLALGHYFYFDVNYIIFTLCDLLEWMFYNGIWVYPAVPSFLNWTLAHELITECWHFRLRLVVGFVSEMHTWCWCRYLTVSSDYCFSFNSTFLLMMITFTFVLTNDLTVTCVHPLLQR
jgi:hypothetical protein